MNECFGDFFFLNGNFLPKKDFNSAVFSKGNSYYEVIRVIMGKCLFIEDHLNRLQSSLQLTKFKINEIYTEYMNYIRGFILKSKISEGNIKLVINFNNVNSNIYDIYIYQLKHKYPTIEEYKNGVQLSIFYMNRLNPNVKYIDNELGNTINNELESKGVFEVLLVDNNDIITEGSKSNIFFIKNEIVYTAPEIKVLPGITRLHVIKLCKSLKVKIKEKGVKVSDVFNYNAVFLTGTSPKILPVKKIENYSYSVNNEIMFKLMNSYNEVINNYISD